MTGERQVGNVRFGREKIPTFKLADGSWESVLVGLKDHYQEDMFGVDEAGYWGPIEEKATMNLRKACFQYFLAGDGHMTLAEKVVDNSPQIRIAVGLGTMSASEKRELVNRIAGFLYDYYPEKYKDKINK